MHLLRNYFLTIFLYSAIVSAFAQGVNISAQLKGIAPDDTLVLASVYVNNQYAIDTATRDGDLFTFHVPDSTFDPGVFYIIPLSDKQFFQIIVDQNDTNLKFSGDKKDLLNTLLFDNSVQNTTFYEYLRFLNSLKDRQKQLTSQQSTKSDEEIQQALKDLDKEVFDYQTKIVNDHPNTILAVLVGNVRNVSVPDFGEEENPRQKRFQFFRKHYFDYFDFTNDKALRTPGFFQKIDDYVHKYTIVNPDSIYKSIDFVLEKMEKNAPKSYQFFLAHYLNEYVKSPRMGMDQVYVKLVDNYYSKGRADWVSEENLNKILDNANFFRHTVIGQPTPPLGLKTRQGETFSIFDHEAKVTILVFWSPTCSHCRKELPALDIIYREYKDKEVSLITICTKESDECWEFIDEKNLEDSWINARPTTNCYRTYDLRRTPKIYVLDEKKNIQFKNIGVESLKEVVDLLLNTEWE